MSVLVREMKYQPDWEGNPVKNKEGKWERDELLARPPREFFKIVGLEPFATPDDMPDAEPRKMGCKWYWVSQQALQPKTDTERLDFLLQFFRVCDIGDEDACPGVIVDSEDAEEALSWTPLENGKGDCCICSFKDDLRTVIDNAIILKNRTTEV